MSTLAITVSYSAGSLVIQGPGTPQVIQISTPGTPSVIQLGTLSAAVNQQITQAVSQSTASAATATQEAGIATASASTATSEAGVATAAANTATTEAQAAATFAAASANAYSAIANGTATPAGALTGTETVPVSRGSGLLQSTWAAVKTLFDSWYLGYDGNRKQNYVAFPNSIEVGRKMRYTVGRQGSGCDLICTGVADDIAINAALLWLHQHNNFTGWILEFSDEQFFLASPLIRQAYVSIIGQGSRTTQFIASSGLSGGMQQLAPGAIQFLEDRSYHMIGGAAGAPTNPGCWAMQLVAQPLAAQGNAGGLWNSTFEDIQIDFFDNGIYSQGDLTSASLLPQQFVNFRDVDVNQELSTGLSLYMRGQHGQITFDSCTLQNRVSTNSTGTIVQIGNTADTQNAPGDISFVNHCTFQNAANAVVTYGANGVKVRDAWFENLKYSIGMFATSRGGVVSGCRFANASSDGSNGGYCLHVDAASDSTFDDNLVLGICDYVATGANSHAGVFGDKNTVLSTPNVTTTSGVTLQYPGTTNGILQVFNQKSVAINCTSTTISNISSTLLTGELLTLYMTAGTATQVLASSGNIDFGGITGTSLTVRAGSVLQFIVTDLVARRFRIVSISNGNGNVILTPTTSATASQAPKCTMIYSAALTATATVAQNTTNPCAGDVLKVVRTVTCTGAFNITIGSTNLTIAGTWVEFTYSGSAWVETAAGSLI